MKKTTMTAAIAFVILLLTGALFKALAPAPDKTDGNAPATDGLTLMSILNDNKTQDANAAPEEGYDAPIDTKSADQAVIRLKALREKMTDDGVDVDAMMKNLEERLRTAPDGKISEKDVIGVVPPEYAEEFKTIINEMYYPGTINPKENQQ